MLFRYYYIIFFCIQNFHSIVIFQLRSVQHSMRNANSLLAGGRISCNTFFQMHCSHFILCFLSISNRKKIREHSLFSGIAWIQARTKIFHLYYHVYHIHLRPLYHLMYTNALSTLTLVVAW